MGGSLAELTKEDNNLQNAQTQNLHLLSENGSAFEDQPYSWAEVSGIDCFSGGGRIISSCWKVTKFTLN